MSFFQVLLAILVLLLLRVIHTRIISPLFRMRHYVKQGAMKIFYLLPSFFENLKDAKEHGDFFYRQKRRLAENPNLRLWVINNGSNVSVYFSDPKLIKEFFQNQDKYVKREFGGAFNAFFGKGIFSAEVATWRRHRKAVSDIFHFDFLKSIVPVMDEVACNMYAKYCPENSNSGKISLLEQTQKVTGQITGHLFFGNSVNDFLFDGENAPLAVSTLMMEIMKTSQSLPVWLFGDGFARRYVSSYKATINKVLRFREFCKDMIKDAQEKSKTKNSTEKPNLLQHLLVHQENFSPDEIVDDFLTIFIAGTDTSAHVASMAIYYLYQNPELLAKVREECKKVFSSGSRVTHQDLQTLELTEAVIKESLRIAPPAPVLMIRKATVDHYLGDIHVKKGTGATVSFLANMYNPAIFPNPEKFDISRWLNRGSESKTTQPNHFSYLPFSAGPRNCIGQHVGTLEAKILLGRFLTMFDYEIPKDYKLRMTTRFVYEPADPIHVDVHKRQ